MIYIKFGILNEDGEKQKDLYEMYVSRKSTFLDIKEKLCKLLKMPDL